MIEIEGDQTEQCIKPVSARVKRTVKETISRFTFVRTVQEVRPEGDKTFDIDYLVHFINKRKHLTVGLTLRETQEEIQRFMSTLEPGRRIIGIYVDKNTPIEHLRSAFRDQLQKLDECI